MKRVAGPVLLLAVACSPAAPPANDSLPLFDGERAGTEQVTATALHEPRSSQAASHADWSVAAAMAVAPRCGIDEVLHRIAGQPLAQDSDAICPELPAALDPVFAIEASPLFYFDIPLEQVAETAAGGHAGFILEGSMPDVGPPGSPRLQCIYLGCAKLQVADHGEPTEGTESCLGPLLAGTSQPARDAPDCPAAVMISGAFRPFTRVRSDGHFADRGAPACCYSIPAPVPPAPGL